MIKRIVDEKKKGLAKYPRHSLEKALRIPKAILEQNAGKNCTDKESASFVGVGFNGPYRVEISSALKYGFLERPSASRIQPTELAKRILRPKDSNDEITGFREALLKAPEISAVYKHYRGESLPDPQFFDNTLMDTFEIPEEKVGEFKDIFMECLKNAKLLEKHNDKFRVIDFSVNDSNAMTIETKKSDEKMVLNAQDTCFVVMPFAEPLGGYYSSIYHPAIQKAGLIPVRADNEIFSTGKIMDQIWAGINSAKVLVAELTTRNPNVFYELGLAHALRKPVVLISSKEEDVPFDLHHIRVIYYDMSDPFWGQKLITKVSENIVSALKNPEEAIFFKDKT